MRSFLFAPASRPDLLAKLPRSSPDAICIDLEDAVAPIAKESSRSQAREVGAELAAAHPNIAVWVRVNGLATEWFEGDIAAGLPANGAGVVLPKAASADDIERAATALDRAGHTGLAILAGIETVAGVVNAREVFTSPRVTTCYFGAEDYTADLGGERRADGIEVLWARSQVAAFARLHGVWALDMVVTDFGNGAAFSAEASLGRALGYRGKLCIHPSQVALAHAAFSPTAEQIERARRMIDVYEEASARGIASVAFEGEMIDEPIVRRARRLLDADRKGATK